MTTPHTTCPHCPAPAPKTPHRLVRAAVIGLAWTVAMAYVFMAIMLGPAIIFVLPLLFLMGIGLVSSAHAWSYGDRACEACGKLVELDGEPVEVTLEPAGHAGMQLAAPGLAGRC